MYRSCQRFPIPKTIEWINNDHYIVAINGRDENSEESDASHGYGKKDAKMFKTRKAGSTAVRTRKSCKNIDGIHHNIGELNGQHPERVTKKNKNRRREHKGSTQDLTSNRRSKGRSHQSHRSSDVNGQVRRRGSLQSASSKADSDVQECMKAEDNDMLGEFSDATRLDPKNFELRPHPTDNSDLPISMLASLLCLKLADAIEQGLYSSDDSAAMDCRKN
ncbi:hypothetical protein MHU86_3039 [Fragilaria crotonensis]|nr:hypothetical protein MHU86_3039 [Fragilaria crotonensis]